VAEELGFASAIAIPATNAAERQIARHEAGASLEEVYAEQVGPEAPLAAPPSGNDRSSRTGSETDAPEEPVRG
jgi:hypothetical protein